MTDHDRTPPQDIPAEQSAIGGMLLSTAAIEDVREILGAEDFYKPAHATIFRTILKLHDAGEPSDPITVAAVLVDTGEIVRIGGAPYLHHLVETVPTAANAGHYARIVAERASRRRLIEAGYRIVQNAFGDGRGGGLEPAELLRGAQDTLEGLVKCKGRNRRVVDLTPYLDGTYTPPVPSVGGQRQDHVRMLYPGKWHTIVAPTTSGKSWFALWNVVAEMRQGNTVAYAHFEEVSPAGTINRLQLLGCSVDMIQQFFVWMDCTTAWRPGEFATALPDGVTLLILDGIVAACSQHGWNPLDPAGEGEYKERFVKPAMTRGAAVVGLGHPVKNQDRKWEPHGLGTTAWLDNVDGVGFRLMPGKNPIKGGQSGSSALYSVKDRASQVEAHARPEKDHPGWYYLGQFVVDSSPGQTPTAAYVTAPRDEEDDQEAAGARDAIDELADAILAHLKTGTGKFDSGAKLGEQLRAHKVTFGTKDVAPALTRLTDAGRIEWPEVQTGRPRPGWLCEEVPPNEAPN